MYLQNKYSPLHGHNPATIQDGCNLELLDSNASEYEPRHINQQIENLSVTAKAMEAVI